MTDRAPSWTVETRTRASSFFLPAAIILVMVMVAAPAFVGRGMLRDLFFILTMLVLAQSWNLLAGYAGLVSVGQQAFVGFGAYAMFACVSLAGLDPLAAILVGGLAAGLLALPTGFFVFRLHGAYFAIGTWVIAEVVRLSLAQWKALGGGTGTSLPAGATRDLAPVAWIEGMFGVRSAHALDILTYWLALALAVAAIAFVYRFLLTRQGLGLAAIRDNEQAAGALGVDAGRLKWGVWVATAVMTGLTGALIYVQTARISPDAAFSVIDWTAYVIFIVVIGGIGTIEGPIVGVIVFFILRNSLSDYGSWYLLVLGLIGILVMLFAPRGLWGLFADRTGLQLFPVRRTLRQAISTPKTTDTGGGPHG
jgi:branched-chain amino acid transport system permease protein